MQPNSPDTKSAGIIIIGNEILSGKIIDANSSFLASELRALGVNVMRITVIPDDVQTIGDEAFLFSGHFDHVFTSGGIGPTHDDVTIEGIAHGFGVNMVPHPILVEWFKNRYGDSVNEAVMKMTLIPEGADLLGTGGRNLPVVLFKNIVVFPGIPELLKRKFLSIKGRFRCANFLIKRLFIKAEESSIADSLREVSAKNPDITIGSYPIIGNSEYSIIITAESKSDETLKRAVSELLRLLPERIIFRVE